MNYKLTLLGLVVAIGLVLLIWSNGQMRPGTALPVVAQDGRLTIQAPPSFARGTVTFVYKNEEPATNSAAP